MSGKAVGQKIARPPLSAPRLRLMAAEAPQRRGATQGVEQRPYLLLAAAANGYLDVRVPVHDLRHLCYLRKAARTQTD